MGRRRDNHGLVADGGQRWLFHPVQAMLGDDRSGTEGRKRTAASEAGSDGSRAGQRLRSSGAAPSDLLPVFVFLGQTN